ncbi:hypothetical protein VPJ68_09055, partial [Parabacteroides distasonis]
QEVREYLAEMGFTKLNDIVGHTELIETKAAYGDNEKYALLDFSRLLYKEQTDNALYHVTDQHHELENVLDQQIIRAAQRAIDTAQEVNLDYAIKNTDRACGLMLSGTIARKYGGEGLPDNTINI